MWKFIQGVEEPKAKQKNTQKDWKSNGITRAVYRESSGDPIRIAMHDSRFKIRIAIFKKETIASFYNDKDLNFFCP